MDLTGPNKDTVAVLAFKIALSLYRAVVFAIGVIQLDTDPYAWSERGLANEEHLTMAEIGDFDA